MEKFYLTTTLPYVNAAPHLGFALEIVQADIVARYERMLGKEVIFNTGTDEHGLKIYRKAEEEGVAVQEYVDRKAGDFEKLRSALGLSYTHFTRTTDPHHIVAAQEFWRRCEKDIEKRTYQTKYCVGCELEKTDSELDHGRCLLHPNTEIELIEEENYFFLFSRYSEALLALYDAHPEFVLPHTRLEEITSFVKKGLKDFSISRLKSKMPWGVPVPGDSDQVMYVWFDALVNYISMLGWPEDEARFSGFWPGVQFAGKDNLRQQSAMWQAMLLSAGLQPSKQIIIHGFITSGGQKMSKSVGNVIDPLEVVERYGTDALRYWLSREANPFEDSDFTWEKFHESYTGNLVNGLGNVVSRTIGMAHLYSIDTRQAQPTETEGALQVSLDGYEIKRAADVIWEELNALDRYIQETVPFKTIKTDPDKAKSDVLYLLKELWKIAIRLQPFLPTTSEKILTALKENQPVEPLFPRVEFKG